MKKIAVSILLLPIVFCTMSQNMVERDKDFPNNFPYLYQIIGEYAADNFEYPTSVENILEYWKHERKSKRLHLLFERSLIRAVDTMTFKRLARERDQISLGFTENNEFFFVCYKQDTLFTMPTKNFQNPSKDYFDIDASRMNLFFWTSMFRTKAPHYSHVHDEDEHFRFHRGIYKMISDMNPEFNENRRQRKAFKTLVLVYEDGNLTAKYREQEFDPATLPFYEEIRQYVTDYAQKHRFFRIIFYYMYD